MFDDFQPELLFADFVEYSSPRRRDELSRQCRAKVVEWRWASGDMAFAFREPFLKERYREEPAWLKDGEPKPRDLRHGLDAQGAIHVVDELAVKRNLLLLQSFDEQQISPKYAIYGENTIDHIVYRTPGSLQLIRRRTYDGQRLIREHAFGSSHGSEEHFEWEGDRLDRILGLGWRHECVWHDSAAFFGYDANSHTETRFEYDHLGRLDRVVKRLLNEDGSIYEGLPPRIEYQRPKENESIPQLAKEIERMLEEQIPAAAEKARGKGPFYCLLLFYYPGDFGASWPPGLVMKAEAERQRIIKRGEHITYYLWAPDESEETNVRAPLNEETLLRCCNLHNQLMAEKDDWSSGKEALRGVANALNELEWSKIMDVTPDFVVAAVDNTGESDFATDIEACIPAAKFRDLKQRGLV